MKYNEKIFNKAVNVYIKKGKRFSRKNVQILLPFKNEDAFYSIAPLSKALHEMNADLRVSVLTEKKSKNWEILTKVWETFEEMKSGIINKKTKALKEFINAVNKKAGNADFEKYLKKPDILLEAKTNGFYIGNEIVFEYNSKWFKKFKEKELGKACRKVLKYTFNAKAKEVMSIGFELVPAKKDMELPLEDYLDNFTIARVMGLEALKKKLKVSIGASSNRKSMVDEPNRIGELSAVISGCEYDKNVNEPVFKAFKRLSSVLGINKWQYADLAFSIHGKGYGGKHFFGINIGYPSLDRKTRWKSPTDMFLKPWWNVQTSIDKRKPKLRLAITETIPIEEFIETTDIDYEKMRTRNERIGKILAKCRTLHVIGEAQGKYRTDFSIDLEKGKKRRFVEVSDSDARYFIDRKIKKLKGIDAGMFANVPGGEAFFTPENINGMLVGDVVINIDRSYVLSSEDPVIWRFKNGKYKTVRAPRKIKKQMQKEYRDLKKLIKEYEKKKSLPKKIIKMYKDNFWRVGEFAINTNPKAKLSRYLIVNEKIANMIHVAVGSGFEPDRQTVYHWDMVVNCPKQKINIYGIDKKQKKHWILKKGKFVI